MDIDQKFRLIRAAIHDSVRAWVKNDWIQAKRSLDLAIADAIELSEIFRIEGKIDEIKGHGI